MLQLMTVAGLEQHWDPFGEMARLCGDVDQIFWRGRFPREGNGEFPAINVIRLPERLVIEAVAPGVDRSTLDVTVAGDMLTIRGTRADEVGDGSQTYHRREREKGPFVRTLKLDERVTTDDVTASYRDGILRIELRYAPETKPRKVKVTD